MNSSDYERFVSIMETLAQVYGKKLTNEQIAVYWQALEDRDIADVERRISDHVKRAKFFPKPRELRPVEADHSDRVEANPEADLRFKAAQAESCANWDRTIREQGDVGKLRLCEALWARYGCDPEQGATILASKREWLKGRMVELIRILDPRAIVDDFHLRRMVLQVFGGPAIYRLQDRADALRKVAA